MRRFAVLLLSAALFAPLLPAAAPAAALYEIDQNFGSIAWAVRSFGVFTTRGQFDRFFGRLALDFEHPGASTVDVTIDAGSVASAWQPAVDMLRSPDFFDVPRYPQIRFRSTGVETVSPDHYRIQGQLQMRGVTRPLDLHAVLLGRRRDPARGGEAADFVVSGALNREDFGMTAQSPLISDTVRFTIHARILLEHGATPN